jgi:hypothetical protein
MVIANMDNIEHLPYAITAIVTLFVSIPTVFFALYPFKLFKFHVVKFQFHVKEQIPTLKFISMITSKFIKGTDLYYFVSVV